MKKGVLLFLLSFVWLLSACQSSPSEKVADDVKSIHLMRNDFTDVKTCGCGKSTRRSLESKYSGKK